MYIFFDVDGVLNTKSQWRKLYSLNEMCVKKFCALVHCLGAEPVLISSWRHGFISTHHEENSEHIKQLEDLFARYDVKISDKTPKLIGRPREKEIERFLYFHPMEHYIIVDDDRGEYQQITKRNYFVNAEKGFCDADIKEIEKVVKRLQK